MDRKRKYEPGVRALEPDLDDLYITACSSAPGDEKIILEMAKRIGCRPRQNKKINTEEQRLLNNAAQLLQKKVAAKLLTSPTKAYLDALDQVSPCKAPGRKTKCELSLSQLYEEAVRNATDKDKAFLAELELLGHYPSRSRSAPAAEQRLAQQADRKLQGSAKADPAIIAYLDAWKQHTAEQTKKEQSETAAEELVQELRAFVALHGRMPKRAPSRQKTKMVREDEDLGEESDSDDGTDDVHKLEPSLAAKPSLSQLYDAAVKEATEGELEILAKLHELGQYPDEDLGEESDSDDGTDDVAGSDCRSSVAKTARPESATERPLDDPAKTADPRSATEQPLQYHALVLRTMVVNSAIIQELAQSSFFTAKQLEAIIRFDPWCFIFVLSVPEKFQDICDQCFGAKASLVIRHQRNLSRSPETLVSIGRKLDIRKIIEQGPSDKMITVYDKCFRDKEEGTLMLTRELLSQLGEIAKECLSGD